MIRRVRNIAFIVMMVALVIAAQQDLKAYECSPWNCNESGCSGTCYTCGMMAQACMEHCGGMGGLPEGLNCQDQLDPPSASGSCNCIFPIR